MKISTLRSQRKRPMRLMFTHYLVENYGVNVQTAYGKLRRMQVRRWEAEGIRRCILTFAPEYNGELKDFYAGLPSRIAFARFMKEKMQMSEKTTDKRFGAFDFTPLEIKGLDEAYQEFKEIVERDEE